ncbi:MAG: NAD(P)/FAD-dependent oxidoreductase [Actinobacteria bacterium]|nr:NAD(P)/FAD-dependent oxidoreductase [Actinomycetota bacterium]
MPTRALTTADRSRDVSAPTVIVGGGIAAQSVAESLRATGHRTPIVMLSAEARAPYDRVRLSYLLAESGDADDLRLRPDEWYADADVDLRLGVWAESVDRDACEVVTAVGERIAYGALVLATGSTALVPPIPGIDKRGVEVFRTPEDCGAILAAAAEASRVAVIGGGLLGLEAAWGLVAQGASVTVVHLMDRLMERQLDASSGAILASRMDELGVEVLLGRSTTEVLGNGRVTGLRFADGGTFDCDLVVVSIGIRPQADLARRADLAVGRGIIVDDELRTSDPRIWAVGECAEHRGTVYGLVAPIYDQAKVAAASIAGIDPAPYAGTVPSAALKVMGVSVVSIGDAVDDGGCTLMDGRSGTYRKLAIRDGQAVGAILMGDTRGAELLQSLVTSGAPIDDPLSALAESSRADVWDLPDSAQICGCNGVCKGEILSAIREKGLKAASEVRAITRAGTGCGSCKPLVARLVAAETGEDAAEAAYLCPCRQVTREGLAETIRAEGLRSASDVAASCGVGRDCGACKPGVAYLVQLVNANRHDEERHARFINDRVHANIQRDGTFSVVPRIYGGVTSAAELRRIADVADKYAVPMVKITGGQRIDLLGVKKEQLPDIWADLDMPSGFAYSKALRTVKTCVGTDFCRFGVGDAISLGIEMEKAWEGLHTPHKVKCAVSGCPRNCAEATVKDIGVVAVEGGWEVVVGGAAGASVRKADVLATVTTRADVMRVASTFLQYYRENAEYLERTYGFVERVGMDLVRSVVLDEESGEPTALRERLASARAAVRDPWKAAISSRGAGDPYDDLGADPEPALVGPPPDGAFGREDE